MCAAVTSRCRAWGHDLGHGTHPPKGHRTVGCKGLGRLVHTAARVPTTWAYSTPSSGSTWPLTRIHQSHNLLEAEILDTQGLHLALGL